MDRGSAAVAERPYGVEFIDHIGNGRMKEALEKYWILHLRIRPFTSCRVRLSAWEDTRGATRGTTSG